MEVDLVAETVLDWIFCCLSFLFMIMRFLLIVMNWKNLRPTFWCSASTIYTHASAFYCVLRFHYCSLPGGPMLLWARSDGSLCQSKYTPPQNPNTSICSLFHIPETIQLSLQHIIWFIDLQAWSMKKNIDDYYFQGTLVCRSVSVGGKRTAWQCCQVKYRVPRVWLP